MKRYVDDRPDDGVFRVHREVFSDETLFGLEQKHIFERTWSFLGLETQLRKPNDFITAIIARTSVIVARDAKGKLGAFLNACRHKGALVCRSESGNAKYLVCAYHGWAYSTAGKNINIKDREAGCYSAGFDIDSHDLLPLPRFESYKGLLFGSLNADVPPLKQFLGEICTLLDLAMDQGPQGMEFVPGRITYTFDANWKLQMDNGNDFYHLTSTHPSLMAVVERREQAKTGNVEARQFDWSKRFTQQGGSFTFRNGHTSTWLNQGQPENRPIFSVLDEARMRVGATRAEWMLKLRNLTIFPNMQIADATSLLIRTFRPLAVDKTEMRVWCLAPIGEAAEVRAWRLRQFEDFFNVSGMATPDDTSIYEDAQVGFQSTGLDWLQGYQRGISAVVPGANASAAELAMTPATSTQGSYDMQTETCFHATYREWARLMQAGESDRNPYDG
jgi:phenylpropionate dioxygenase-like ring-hydroxylating dioxygenase large terminal subunit